MIHKFTGAIKVEANPSNPKEISVKMPSCIDIPPKTEWHSNAVWEFNGKAYKPLTTLAENALAAAVQEIQKLGFSGATKDGRRKPTSIRYAILTTGVEPFYYIK